GIRDWSVTGVQTCALPIYRSRARIWLRKPLSSRPLHSAIAGVRRLRDAGKLRLAPRGLHPAHRTVHERGGAGQAKLFLYVAAVNVDRLGAQVKQLGGVARGLALGDEAKDLEFAVRQLLDRRGRPTRTTGRQA